MSKYRQAYVLRRKSYVALTLSTFANRKSSIVNRTLLILLPLLLLSCSSGSSLMPSDVGTTWTYKVRTGFGAQHVVDATITKRLSVTGAEGFELSGPLGATRMAWKDGTLWAQNFGNAQAMPALPLLHEDRRPSEWKGILETAIGKERATARLTHANEKLESAGRTISTTRTQLVIKRPRSTTTLTTWFAEGIGIVRQEQRSDGEFELRLDRVSGPRSTEVH